MQVAVGCLRIGRRWNSATSLVALGCFGWVDAMCCFACAMADGAWPSVLLAICCGCVQTLAIGTGDDNARCICGMIYCQIYDDSILSVNHKRDACGAVRGMYRQNYSS